MSETLVRQSPWLEVSNPPVLPRAEPEWGASTAGQNVGLPTHSAYSCPYTALPHHKHYTVGGASENGNSGSLIKNNETGLVAKKFTELAGEL